MDIAKSPKSKICITTYYNKAFSEIGGICYRSIQKYAGIHELDVRTYFDDISIDRPVPWYKIIVIQKLFSLGYEYVLWMDADSLFIRYDQDIKGEIEKDKELYLVQHNIGGKEGPNTGVFLLKNSNWSNNFLNTIWNMTKYINHKWWENAAVIDALGYTSLLTESKNNLNLELLEHVKWLDLKWNSLPGVCETNDAIINHYAGRPLGFRIEHMKNVESIQLQLTSNQGNSLA